MATPDSDRPAPKAFISYSWDDVAHKEWVKQFATRLRADGVDVTLDRLHAMHGDQLPAFMERAVRESDFVIVVCTSKFKEKANGRGGGVGYEGDVMTAEVFTGGNSRKFIPILRKGIWKDIAPSWLLGSYFIDLSDDPYSESNYQDLLRTLHSAREEAPPRGQRPNFGDQTPGQATPLGRSSTPQHQSSVTPMPGKKPTGGQTPDSNPADEGKQPSIFISYSHKDRKFRDRLATHLSVLKRDGSILSWTDREIHAGDDWHHKIREELENAQVILLLISPDFLASEYCYDVEMKRALEKHRSGDSFVIPVILRPCDWGFSPVGKLQALPKNGKPVTHWKSQDAAFADVVLNIKRALAQRKGQSSQEKSATYTLVISAKIDEVDPEKLDKIMKYLREITGNAEITLRKVEEGSVVLFLEGSQLDFCRYFGLQ